MNLKSQFCLYLETEGVLATNSGCSKKYQELKWKMRNLKI